MTWRSSHLALLSLLAVQMSCAAPLSRSEMQAAGAAPIGFYEEAGRWPGTQAELAAGAAAAGFNLGRARVWLNLQPDDSLIVEYAPRRGRGLFHWGRIFIAHLHPPREPANDGTY